MNAVAFFIPVGTDFRVKGLRMGIFPGGGFVVCRGFAISRVSTARRTLYDKGLRRMNYPEPIRILSDLHLGHPAGLIANAGQLAPLIEGCATVLFNGDTVELRSQEDEKVGRARLNELTAVSRASGASPVYVNGNHDPTVSILDHVDLADGGVLVTHGDLLFHDISPWSSEGRVIGLAHTRELQGLGEDAFCNFEKRLRAGKQAALAVETLESRRKRGRLAKITLIARELFPPWRPFYIIKVWIETPDKAVALARVFRPRARLICIGHVHWSGVFRRGPRIIVNTGSFIPTSGRLILELGGGYLNVHEIEKRRGQFHIGRRRHRLEAGRLLTHEGF
jgi:predicted phosphodiesterase